MKILRKWIIDSQPESEDKLRLQKTIDSKISIEYAMAKLKQETEDNEVAMGVLQSGADALAQKLPDVDDLVEMATEISQKALHEFLLVKCKEQMIEFTKKFKLRGNSPKINKLMAKLMKVIDESGSSEEILNIESQMRELVDEDVMSALKNRKNYIILEKCQKREQLGYSVT